MLHTIHTIDMLKWIYKENEEGELFLKTKYNDDIRKKAKEAGMSLCELAYNVQISESALFQWLRHPLTDERRQILLRALDN